MKYASVTVQAVLHLMCPHCWEYISVEGDGKYQWITERVVDGAFESMSDEIIQCPECGEDIGIGGVDA